MNDTHIEPLLYDYVAGALGPDERAVLEAHLQSCPVCRAAEEQVRVLQASTAELPRSVAPPEDLWPGIQERLHSRSQPPEPRPSTLYFESRTRLEKSALMRHRTRIPAWQVLTTVLVLLSVGAGLWLLRPSPADSAWNVVRIEGAPRIASSDLVDIGKLRKGDWLETGRNGRAKITVGAIGNVEVAPNSRVRLVDDRPENHRLALSQGVIEARIWAPPRLFFVETPSALAIDLGCAYRLSVDSTGASLLDVASGWVALAHEDRETVVPAGAMCLTRPGAGPGTPFDRSASVALRRALERFDFEGDADALNMILEEAGPGDTVTLWHLLVQAEPEARGRLYDRLAALEPPPEGVTREAVLQGNTDVLEHWERYLGMDYDHWDLDF